LWGASGEDEKLANRSEEKKKNRPSKLKGSKDALR
jgi:hypothetical protein